VLHNELGISKSLFEVKPTIDLSVERICAHCLCSIGPDYKGDGDKEELHIGERALNFKKGDQMMIFHNFCINLWVNKIQDN